VQISTIAREKGQTREVEEGCHEYDVGRERRPLAPGGPAERSSGVAKGEG
jgi:hypothetical protein